MAVIQAMELAPFNSFQKSIVKERYSSVLLEYKRRKYFYSYLFHTLRGIITIGSLIVPALLSVQFGSELATAAMYWITWTLSLLVTMSNGLFTLYKIDKKYYMLHTIYEQLLSEGWQFIQLTGKYSGFYTPTLAPTHENQFRFFCHAIEKIKMKQVEEEYFKVTESGHAHTTKENGKDPKSNLPPTPALQLLQQLLSSKKGTYGPPAAATAATAAAAAAATQQRSAQEGLDEEEIAIAFAEALDAASRQPPSFTGPPPIQYSEISTSSSFRENNAPESEHRTTLSV